MSTTKLPADTKIVFRDRNTFEPNIIVQPSDLVVADGFSTNDTALQNYVGKPFILFAVVNHPDNFHDVETLPIFGIEFEDGEKIEARSDEIFTDESLRALPETNM